MKKFSIIFLIISVLSIQLAVQAAFENLNDLEITTKAHNADKEGDYSTALSYYSEVLRRDPDNYAAYNMRGMIYLEQYNNYTQALNDFSSAIKYGSPNSGNYTFRGFTRMKLGDLDGSISDLTKAISINNQNKTPDAFAYCTRALVYSMKQEHKLSIEDATVSIKLQPKNPEAYQFRGLSKVLLYSKQHSSMDLQSALEGVQSGLNDINYAKEQFLQGVDMEGYQGAIEAYKATQNIINTIQREISKRSANN